MHKPSPRELVVAVMVVLLFFCIGGAFGCMADLSSRLNEPLNPPPSDELSSPIPGGTIYTKHLDTGDICYILYINSRPINLSCTGIIR